MIPRLLLAMLFFSGMNVAVAEEIPRPEHPDPMAMRAHWANLNGTWQFRFDPQNEGEAGAWHKSGAEGFDRTIVVPFCWESELSGIQDTSGQSKIGWYRRTFRVPGDLPKDHHVWLRFGAVDWRADVWLNGTKVGEHEGGYTPFEFDITDHVKRDAENVVVVRAFDPTDPSLPTGKQVGWYTPTSGIWQTVWLEARPTVYIHGFSVRPKFTGNGGHVEVEVRFPCFVSGDYRLTVYSDDPSIEPAPAFSEATRIVGEDSNLKSGDMSSLTIGVGMREPKPWTPESPHLYEFTMELKAPDGTLDRVKSYFALREVKRGKLAGEDFERILLNGKPIYVRLALDQSFNPKGIYTAPSDNFLRKDIEMAKSFGLNGLRIHIKPDEPRRLYWADKLGLLIMEDMPNTWRQSPRARAAWEATMRETIARDRNHPCIFSWVAFNETWGLGRPDDYKRSKDTQDWVKRMVKEIRALDPTRLVEDNSPCNYDHVSVTDLNSWHFYIDNAEEAKRHIEDVVARSLPGSDFNHCPDEKMNEAPLINSEYGAVSAGGGDRDISWGFRDLTTQLRKHNKIQGYVYTELTDIEWEHNGFADYDRSPKTFGYDSFVPGMTVADLQGADFVGYDAPPVIVAKVGDTVRVPVFVSHYSELAEPATLRWWVTGVNPAGETDRMEPKERPAEWKAYDVVMQSKPVTFRIHGPLVGAVCLELVDKAGKRLAANFTNLVIQPERPAPRVERIDDRHVALRISPEDASLARWSGGYEIRNGKVAGRGAGTFTYKLALPATVRGAKPKSVHIDVELAARAGRENLDWSERSNWQDNPQTDTRPTPSSLRVACNGEPFDEISLADDWADARGVLSHLQAVDHGSHGEFTHIHHELRESTRADLASGKPLILNFDVPASGKAAGGLSVFGSTTGAYPLDPTIILETEGELPIDLGVDVNKSVCVDTITSRRKVLVISGSASNETVQLWAYATEAPGRDWVDVEFDDSVWKSGAGGFGTSGTPGIHVETEWNTPEIWLRTHTDPIPALAPSDQLTLRLYHDEDAEVYVNGKRLLAVRGYVTSYREIVLNDEQRALFHVGKNTIAAHCRQTTGGQGIDLGLILTRGE